MSLRSKMMISASLLAVIPVVIASFTIGSLASSNSKVALKEAAQNRIVATRDITKGRIEDYFSTIRKQILTLSHNPTLIQAARDFTVSFSEYKTQADYSLTNAKPELRNYYENTFLAEYKQKNTGKTTNISLWLDSLDQDSIALQHKLIVANSNPLGEKDKLIDLADSSDYNTHHKKYHPVLKEILDEFGYYDIFIVSASSGDIVYSVFKELDFSTSLKDGVFSQSGIGQAFKKVMSTGEVSIVDFAPYGPSYDDPASFIAAPLIDTGNQVAVLIFQMPVDSINNIMTYSKNWQGSGLGLSGESYLVGPDKKSRTLSRFLIEDKPNYIKALKKGGMESKVVDAIKAKNTNIGLQANQTIGVDRALNGTTGVDIFPDYRSVNVLSAYAPVNIEGLNWGIMTEIDEAEAFKPATELATNILNTSIIVSIILLIVGLTVGIVFSKFVSRPIIRFSQLLQKIQNDSDLTLRSDVHTKDEIGAASESLNQMLNKFQQSLTDVAASSEQIATATEQTSVISAETRSNVSEQQIATEQVATATSELTMTVQEVTRNISLTADAANKACIETIEGDKALKGAISDITSFAKQTSKAADSIQQLRIDTENISQVVDVIKSIADQTNLLALNAAIEAARAGEQGRGFAVVADEVRTLAGRTQESTEEINQMVEQLQNSAQNSVQLIDSNKEQIQQVVEKAEEAGRSLVNISNSVDEINLMSTQISVSAEEQVNVTEEVNQNLVQITAIAERTSEGSKQTSLASEELARLALTMSDLVKQFKLE